MDDFDGLAQPATRKRGRPSNAELEARRQEALRDRELQARIRAAASGQAGMNAADFLKPVSQNFLANVFRMDPATVKKRLLNCRPLGMAGGNRPMYEFVEACGYLIKPKMSVEEFARTLNKADVPPEFNNAFWQAQRGRIKYKIEAQEAWETADVLEVLGDAGMTIKDSLVMIVEDMRRDAKLDDAQCGVLESYVDKLRQKIHAKLIGLPDQKQTGSMYDKPLWGMPDGHEMLPVVTDDMLDDDEDDIA